MRCRRSRSGGIRTALNNTICYWICSIVSLHHYSSFSLVHINILPGRPVPHCAPLCIAKGQGRTQCSHGWPREVIQDQNTVCCETTFRLISAMTIIHCWNCFIDFNGLSYDCWAKCPHFFTARTIFGGFGGLQKGSKQPRNAYMWPKAVLEAPNWPRMVDYGWI